MWPNNSRVLGVLNDHQFRPLFEAELTRLGPIEPRITVAVIHVGTEVLE